MAQCSEGARVHDMDSAEGHDSNMFIMLSGEAWHVMQVFGKRTAKRCAFE